MTKEDINRSLSELAESGRTSIPNDFDQDKINTLLRRARAAFDAITEASNAGIWFRETLVTDAKAMEAAETLARIFRDNKQVR